MPPYASGLQSAFVSLPFIAFKTVFLMLNKLDRAINSNKGQKRSMQISCGRADRTWAPPTSPRSAPAVEWPFHRGNSGAFLPTPLHRESLDESTKANCKEAFRKSKIPTIFSIANVKHPVVHFAFYRAWIRLKRNHSVRLPQLCRFSPPVVEEMTNVVELKVGWHCEECIKKILKAIKKMEDVDTYDVDVELNKVTVTGNVASEAVIRALRKIGKQASSWGSG
ncbi:uncharacterized protein LOC115743823 [Rhodamnia argentea]|uniref:Uncharacterized protein LOC115743823 n=1 Tax=Rhodamnia argentea TaxID=178133 RepID=A0A8B8PJS7_9MYRT|nr:uncharacterized protein LOC115743823 [Rhodamnia argentea]